MRRQKKKKTKLVIKIFLIIILVIGGLLMFKNKTKNDDLKPKKDNITNIKEEKSKDVTNELEHAPENYEEFSKLNDGEYLTKEGFTLTKKNNIAYIDNNIIVNKTYSLPENYIPTNTYEQITGERCNNCLTKETMESFKEMQTDASAIGLNIYISSGYRSYTYQNTLYNNYTQVSGVDGADTYSARPGHSEHQSGTCFDLNSVDDSFAYTNEGKWINNNAHLYGFIIRYPKGKEDITGYMYESWHLRYIGKDLAKKLYNDGNWLTLEEYYGITSSY